MPKRAIRLRPNIVHRRRLALGAALKRRDPPHVVRTVVYVTDLAFQQKVTRAHCGTFGAIRPASTLVQVVALTPSAALVEIEATAIVTE